MDVKINLEKNARINSGVQYQTTLHALLQQMVTITKRNERYNHLVDENIIKKFIEFTLETEGENSEDVEVSVLLTDDTEIRELNRIYRGVDFATDVLAFAMREGEDSELNPSILGDIVISIDTAQRQSEEVGSSLKNELALLAVHGTLHLLGYDDQKYNDAKIMREREKAILSDLEF